MRTPEEWLLAFNQYYNNITSNKAPGLEPYEISLFLTDAQRAVVLGICTGALGESFESTEQVSNYLAPLVKQAVLTQAEQDPMYENGSGSGDDVPFPRLAGENSYVFKLPDDLLFRTSELCNIDVPNCVTYRVVGQTRIPIYPVASVVPVTQDEYWRTTRNPFKKQNSRKVLRLVYADSEYTSVDSQSVGSGAGQAKELRWKKYSELVSDYEVKAYTVRYVKYPEPIIVEDLSDGLKIEGKYKACPCLLDEALHNAILVKAVQIAQSVWSA